MFIAAADSSKFAAAVAVWSCLITLDSSLSVQNVSIGLCRAWETDLHVIHPLRTLGLLALILIVQSVLEVKGMSGSLGMLTGGNLFIIRLEVFGVGNHGNQKQGLFHCYTVFCTRHHGSFNRCLDGKMRRRSLHRLAGEEAPMPQRLNLRTRNLISN
jgi:hypothetical protein